jgi:hypothetical protein
MRLLLTPSPSLSTSLSLPPPTPSDPPLAFIDSEPFLIELQGTLELPGSASQGGGEPGGGGGGGMESVWVGKMDLQEPVSVSVESWTKGDRY